MNIKDELKKVIEEMERIMVTMDAHGQVGGIHPQWAKGAWNALDVMKPRLEAILAKLIEEDVP